jgi:[pyruvate, water dikinase]-phosphate phosphotransferase / [pyruvate, water dikinase] kinase
VGNGMGANTGVISMSKHKKIVIISDGTGKTAKRLLDAVLAQYSSHSSQFSIVDIFHDIRDKSAFDKILRHINQDYLVIYSIISGELSDYFHKKLDKKGVYNLNVLEPMLGTMSKFLGVHPDYRPGILQIIDDRYYKKVDAIGFTVQHDDGQGKMLCGADIVLLGVSRTCKTPISMYLACNYGVKVANIPIIPHETLKNILLCKLAPIKRESIVGLFMQPEVLARVREERSLNLTDTIEAKARLQDYYDVRTVRDELAFCRKLYTETGWTTVDVTRRAIEEISLEILGKLGLKESVT